MARRSAETRGAVLYQRGPDLPRPPVNLGARGRDLWRSLIHAKPPDYWTPGAILILTRLVRTALTAEKTHSELDRAPSGPEASQLKREIIGLNSSICSLMRALRLSPQSIVHAQASGYLKETTPEIAEVPLLGGVAMRQ